MLLITALMSGLINLPDLWAIGLLAAGVVVVLPLFVLVEKRTQYPVFALRLFSGNRVFTRSNLATVINFGATYAISFFLSLYLQSRECLRRGRQGWCWLPCRLPR